LSELCGGGEMSKRKEEGLFDLLVQLPWWVSVAVGAVVYVVLRFVVPTITVRDLYFSALAPRAPEYAWVAAIFLIPAAFSAIASLSRTLGRAPGGAPVGRAPNVRSTAATGTKTCSNCGGQMVLREAKRGKRVGSTFWGCSNYPKCRHTEEA
jgi:hypothetical protein